MIHIYGGPHDGSALRRRPKPGQTIFLSPEGEYSTKPGEGREALREIGRCYGCGARLGSEPGDPRRFSPTTMPAPECPLCGVVDTQETHERKG